MKVTLDDVAEKAGVSRATVDRVLNERGNVRKSTAERVHRALFSLNYFTSYVPGENERIVQKFDFIFPNLKTGYFENFVDEIGRSALSFERLNTRVTPHMTDDLSPEDERVSVQRYKEARLSLQDADGEGIALAQAPLKDEGEFEAID